MEGEYTTVARAGGLVGGVLGGNYVGETTRDESTLERLIRRLNVLQQAAAEIGIKLRDHADGLHGEQPSTTADKPTPIRCGQIGALEDGIDRLEDTLSYVATQAARNCTLA